MDNKKYITIMDGAGGIETLILVEKLIRNKIPSELWHVKGGIGLDAMDDGSYIPIGSSKYLVFTSDAYTVNPIFFPNSNIGELAVSGVVNDLVAMGARPIAFMDNVIVEEGFPLDELDIIMNSMVKVLVENNIALIGGDFKVMPRGAIDKIIITGFGIGISNYKPIVDMIEPGDKIIVTNTIAEHGTTILAAQMGMLNEARGLRSDVRPLAKSVLPVIEKYREYITAVRDPTRGGLAIVLNEWARKTGLTIYVERSSIPIRPEVEEFLEMLGIDPLTLASEGVMVMSVKPEAADLIVDELKKQGEKPSIIGEVKKPETPNIKGLVIGITEIGGQVIIHPFAYNLPRIC
ncbi:MAG: hydrogenase expression/formation protein HypE [Desulfurococcaceae archaeon]